MGWGLLEMRVVRKADFFLFFFPNSPTRKKKKKKNAIYYTFAFKITTFLNPIVKLYGFFLFFFLFLPSSTYVVMYTYVCM